MSEFKGTSGSWSAFYGTNGTVVVNEDDEVVVSMSNAISSHCEIDANARLIAAAPELLDALRRLKAEVIFSDVPMDYIESHFRLHLDKASAAIAKALGN